MPTTRRQFEFASCLVLLMVLIAGTAGCSRAKYRRAADEESYCLINSRQVDPRWDVPERPVEPARASRMYFGAENDCGPKPQDDTAARRYMDAPDCFDNTKYYSKIADKGYSENPQWVEYLPQNEEGAIQLTQPLAMDLALLHSRDYQTQFENVYLTALDLSGNRFEFDAQWFGGAGGSFLATGEDFGNRRFLDVTANRLGFGKNLPGGGQFATSILNNLFWDFGTGSVQGGSAALVTTFTQPLLRGAFRHVRLEDLTQAERNLLYSVRDFARFRRLFYVNVSTSYLNLLTRLQGIRNSRNNVENLRKSLEEYDEYVRLETKSPIERDQVFLQYQSGRSSLLSSEQDFAEALDAYRFELGLPPWVPLELDESLLDQFELVNPELVALQERTQTLYIGLMQYLRGVGVPQNVLQESFDHYATYRDQVAGLATEVETELERWSERIASTDREALAADDRLDLEQQASFAKEVQRILIETRKSLDRRPDLDAHLLQLIAAADGSAESPADQPLVVPEASLPIEAAAGPEVAAWEALQEAIGITLRGELSDLFVAQTLARLFLIEIEPYDVKQQSAITFAHQNRLDIMNSKAEVMDAFRKVEVAADSLESDLSLTGGVTLGSDPSVNNAFRFDKSANRYRVGVEFDGPLNRLNERNAYRARQIAYQRTSREFVADKDRVANEVRSVLRQLELSRLNFQIARQSLVAATRQVDEAQIALRLSSDADANLTLLLLSALDGLLDARNNLISNWVRYRIQKMQLFAALELLYLDESGRWINADTGLDELADFDAIDPEYFPPQFLQQPAENGETDEAGGSDAAPTSEEALELIEPLPVPEPADRGELSQSLEPTQSLETRQAVRPGVVAPTAPYAFEFGSTAGSATIKR